ncbi:hypothetical protein [Pseudomonas lini]|uniref:Uncharacterized protein n=1 Tax=Pseudomonas lini TaxID=163011 RepID=A0A1H1MQD5_9PSED|nr:hypothetical protein [Pseudomonas lini]KAB0501574.1 hypothetical protein F7R14_22375 [Pseudomonas lini]NSX10507.1 hypothetical protein [Pseudomonas lini]SDR89004.1 hypothetical protein SAMN04490191_0192 [Pseudomonas lini]
MDDASLTSPPSDTPVDVGPPVRIRFSGAGNPNRVRRGGNLEKLPAGDALDAQGNVVPGVTGSWRLVNPLPGVSVFGRGGLDGRVVATNVQQNMTISAVVTTQTSPSISGNYNVVVEVFD